MLSILRTCCLPDLTAFFPQKARAPQPSSKPVSGVKPKEKNLAGYLMAKSAMNRKVEGSTLKNLRAGHGTVQEVIDLLPLGRANVKQDIDKAKDQHLPLRKLAADSLVDHLLTKHVRSGGEGTIAENNAGIAAAAQHAKTGTCGCYAVNTAALHGAKLADLEDKRAVVSIVLHSRQEHEWSEMHPKGVKADGTPILHGHDVILDGWAKEKVAILREDSHFARVDANGRAAHLMHEEPLNHVTGPEALRAVEKYKARIANSPFFQDVFQRKFNQLVDENMVVPKIGLWNDTSVFRVGFRIQAGQALHKDGNPPSRHPDVDPVLARAKTASLTEIQAIGVARSLGANIQGAKAEAPGIIAAAKDMFPNL